MRFGQNRFRFRHWGKHKAFTCEPNQCLALDQIPEGYNATVIHNNDEPNIIVAVGDARYVLDRRIARTIKARISQ
jgi:predicted lipase